MKNNVNILGINFLNKGFNEVVELLSERIAKGIKTFVVTANPEIVMYARENDEYRKIVQEADYIVPDGSGIILAAKILNTPIQERVTGYDLTVRLLDLANQNRWRIYLLGGKEETNKKAVANICEQYPHLVMAGSHNGYFKGKEDKIADEIKAANVDIVFVALGFPRQEKWISSHYATFSKGIFMGVGGSIDVLAGEVKRAPVVWQKLNLEWFYRLAKQPSRWRRMLALPRFLVEILKVKR
ncbi:glycosyltransferase [Bacillus salipaludis]|uniref:N-acetylglucosaminyldiphosphoundecaprenol N-acetyl-beta-D-mannosaminyltransferase n=1 Tax=Bacillus salipaludis TaxID=2547811 RepID=A0A4R5VTH7_9BACI|nr:WecB/TagA/CpsF family glycosyltransferase [Bacillus salipaludis]TDK62198.1 glycosyltransferase [Bacillus salipaludis]